MSDVIFDCRITCTNQESIFDEIIFIISLYNKFKQREKIVEAFASVY